MGVARERTWRILGIDPTTRGFAFAVVEGPDFLVDYGRRRAQSVGDFASAFAELLDKYHPHLVALERDMDWTRQSRAQLFLDCAVDICGSRTTPHAKVSRSQVRQDLDARTKTDIARSLAWYFPELSILLPPERKAWDAEDDRMNVFDALSFARAVAEGL